MGIFRTSSLGDSISSKPERTAPRRWAEEPGCIKFWQQSAGSRNIKRLLLIKEKRISQVKDGLPWWFRQSRICLQCRRPGFDPWVGKIPWRRAWQPTLVFLPGESPWTEEPGSLQSMGLQRVGHDWATKHKLRSLAHFSAWGDARVRAHGGHSFTIHLSYLGASICVSYILSSFSLVVGSDCSSDGC